MVERFESRRDRKVTDCLACDEYYPVSQKVTRFGFSVFWVSLDAIERANNTIIQDPVSKQKHSTRQSVSRASHLPSPVDKNVWRIVLY